LLTYVGAGASQIQSTTLTITSVADNQAQPAYVIIDTIPAAADGTIRLTFGRQNYTDGQGNVWHGTPTARTWDTVTSNPVVGTVTNLGSYQASSFNMTQWSLWNHSDGPLYWNSVNSTYDIVANIVLPDGSYNVTVYGEPGCTDVLTHCPNPLGTGHNVFDFEVQGVTVRGNQDAFTLAGAPFAGYTLTTPSPMTVTNGLATIAYRGRVNTAAAPSGISMSSLMIAPSH
jgi:hypothetical protein